MVIIKSGLFNRYDNVIFGFSTKIGLHRKLPYFFNLSMSVEDDPLAVMQNRNTFFEKLGLGVENTVVQKQIHSDIVTYVEKPGNIEESDAMITDKPNIGLAIATADCANIYIYDDRKKVIGAVHSGWRGTEKNILRKTVSKMEERFNSDPSDFIVYMGPSISQRNYEVGEEVARKFEEEYLLLSNNQIFLDVRKINYDCLLKYGVKKQNIQSSDLCSFSNKRLLHSYRREGEKSGRAFGVIAMRNCEQ